MELDHYPLVSVGVPVFNGASGLTACLDALLRQDYPNLEIVISDNGSTDDTPVIGERYRQLDARVTYSRSEENRGAHWNFNRVFELSSGKYFLWAADDDTREPSFVSACVARLEQEPDSVLCQAGTAIIVEGRNETLCLASLASFDHAREMVGRYRETLEHFPATAIYGMYRASAMRETLLFQRALASEIAFIQELAILGRFVQVPETLFHYRIPELWNTIDQDANVVLGVDRKPWWYLPFVVLFLMHCKGIRRARIPATRKVRLFGVLARYESRQVVRKVVLKLAGALCPDRWKRALGEAMHARWLHNPNHAVVKRDLFFERVCKPQLGWWR